MAGSSLTREANAVGSVFPDPVQPEGPDPGPLLDGEIR